MECCYLIMLVKKTQQTTKICTTKFLHTRFNQTILIPTHSSTFSTKTENLVLYYNTQITSHAKNGDIKEAESLFQRMPTKTIVSYTAMLSAYARNGQIDNARQVFDGMPQRNVATWNAMITGYVKNGKKGSWGIDEGYRLFMQMPERNAKSYASMIMGLVDGGRFDEAKRLYDGMEVSWQDPFCSNILLNGFLRVGRMEEAVGVFEGMLEKNVVSWSSMVNGYCKNGRVDEARDLFDLTEDGRNEYTWCAMIDGYMKSGRFEEGFELFLRMRRENRIGVEPTVMTVVFESCGRNGRYREGSQVHGLVSRMGFAYDVFLGNSVIAMYAKFGCVKEARNLFNLMSEKDLVSWNSLIYGYVQAGSMDEAYELFEKMGVKDSVSWTTLITGFSNKGLTEKCVSLFNQMPEYDDIAWTALISGLVNNGQHEEAIRWFIQMLRRAIMPNPLTLSSLLSSSAILAILSHGLQVHVLVFKLDMVRDLSVQNSIISMYAKCGSVNDAYRVFQSITSPNIISFNSMLTGFAHNGYGEEALELFKILVKEGQEPNGVTFLGVLSACTHMGLVEEGWKYFRSMKTPFKVYQSPDHYACMVDLLGRAGFLDDAVKLIKSMQVDPHVGIWGALLGASRIYLRPDIGEIAAQSILTLEPNNAIPYVVLSDMYSCMGKRKDEEQMRLAKRLRGIKKNPGCSWITVKDKVKSFLSGDKSHLNFAEIKIMLWTGLYEMRQLDEVDVDWLPP